MHLKGACYIFAHIHFEYRSMEIIATKDIFIVDIK